MALSDPPKIKKIEAFPIRLLRDMAQATGTAGSPTRLGKPAGAYRWSSVYPALYSEYLETALVKVVLDSGLYGWGEAQAPLAPRVPCTIVEDLLAPVLQDSEFDGSREAIAAMWNRMYQTMRVRGQTGGFMLDAISGVDLALWDLAGKLHGQPVVRLLSGEGASCSVPAYLSGVAGKDIESRVDFASYYQEKGFTTFKIYHDSDGGNLLTLIDVLRARLGNSAALAVDALWRLQLPVNDTLLRALEARRPYWLECPFPPDEIEPHELLSRNYSFSIALGESYRTLRELRPFFQGGLVQFFQPDLSRSGITETLRIADEAMQRGISLIPHVSVALGPQIAAALHTAAAVPNCQLCEFNPNVFESANRYVAEPLRMRGAYYVVPESPGLGVEILQDRLLGDCLPF